MKVVRVKVKTILLALFILFFTIPYVFYFIGDWGYRNLDKGNENVGTYTIGFLKLYEHYPTVKTNMGKIYYMLGMGNYNYIKEILYFYPSGITANSSNNRNVKQAEIARDYFEKGIQLGEDDRYYVNNLNALINLEMTLGNSDKAFELINKANESESELVSQMALINEVVYYGKIGYYDKGIEICDSSMDYLPLLESYKDGLNYLKGDFDKIPTEPSTIYYTDEYNEKLKISADKNRKIISTNILKDIDFVRDIRMYDNDDFDLEDAEYGEVRGRVLVGNTPIANAKVFIKIQSLGFSVYDNGVLNFANNNYNESQMVYTNKNGEFTFEKIYPDKDYEIVVGIPSVFVDGVTRRETESAINVGGGEKVNVDITFNKEINVKSVVTDYKKDEIIVSYDKVDKAESYGIMFMMNGVGINAVNLASYNEEEIRIPLTNGSLQAYSFLSYDEDENGNTVITSKSILGGIEEKDVWINVIAYDKDYKVLSRSINPIKLDIKKKKLNHGEKLIKDGKIEEGYNWLLEALKKEPNNKEYMYPLMRIAYDRKDTKFGDELVDRLEKINCTGFDEAMRSYYNWQE
ncbi:MAG: carboxypeptidase-like regulatory domain-containing protein [Clostridium sp.]|nr:carboxypeptidase-like regulatory domain-containing protein [Clostridium sp.]